MDKETLDTYDQEPQKFTSNWLAQPVPDEIQRAAKRYFRAGKPTADIGSGSGRDTAWLNQNGYPCTGFDASRGLLDTAKKNFPDCEFHYATLPDLAEIADGAYTNVICETVIMHLAKEDHMSAVKNLLRITAPGGVLSLSWRHKLEGGRDEFGRLYSDVDGAAVVATVKASGSQIMHESVYVSTLTGKPITHVVVRKAPSEFLRDR
ncbi:MAG TPA: class I SAM-dependent methyltransferase [Bdellovibrionota bacterium]|jgi:2-polyprenyl-3-methyl-5-hydroxy-6-metoxy-1,4-benzoquinol methylase|nr:class I SAM-dependent methyltransferase [Bdellovibrionota bacterium]